MKVEVVLAVLIDDKGLVGDSLDYDMLSVP